jgi:hypothetical protein
MAIILHFPAQGITAEKYATLVRRLEAAGAGAPPGRLYHAAYGDPANLLIVDIYESPEAFHRFGETLLPILAAEGIEPGQPEVQPVHNIIPG